MIPPCLFLLDNFRILVETKATENHSAFYLRFSPWSNVLVNDTPDQNHHIQRGKLFLTSKIYEVVYLLFRVALLGGLSSSALMDSRKSRKILFEPWTYFGAENGMRGSMLQFVVFKDCLQGHSDGFILSLLNCFVCIREKCWCPRMC